MPRLTLLTGTTPPNNHCHLNASLLEDDIRDVLKKRDIERCRRHQSKLRHLFREMDETVLHPIGEGARVIFPEAIWGNIDE